MSEAYLLLEDGRSFVGAAAGPPGLAIGEVVFTTAMTGYQEALTDPSFAAQILTFTAPMIGNYGVEQGVGESDGVQAAALVCRAARNAAPPGRTGLLDWLAASGVPAIEEIDTRALVRHLRERGAMLGAVVTDGTPLREAAERIAAAPQMAGQDLTGGVSRPRRELAAVGDERCRVTLIDYGAKDSIARLLAEAGAHVTVLPHDASGRGRAGQRARRHPARQRARRPRRHGRARRAHRVDARAGAPAVRHLPRPPAAGPRARRLETFKLRFGHRGANHPVLERETGRVLGDVAEPRLRGRHAGRAGRASRSRTRRSTTAPSRACGCPDRPVWSMQFHPEAAPGPHDARDALVAFVDRARPRASPGEAA